ncbi:hypothetical protein DFH29DRAFT_787866, partial [Suillus ampliporus]
DLVREAESQLTKEEKQRIQSRKRVEDEALPDEHTTSSSRGEGPSKGKDVDPRNWGNTDIDESDLDLNAQREALSTWAQ